MNAEHPPFDETTAPAPSPRRKLTETALGYGVALILCWLVLGWTYDLRQEARHRPYYYQGDALYYHITTKTLLENGWYQDNPLLGAPGTLNLRDVPTSDNNLHFVLLKLLTLRSQNYQAVLNNYYLLSFPLVMLCALFALRQLRLSWTVGTAMSLLYTFLPYHLIRGEHHLFLSAYWQVPLFCLLLLWIVRGELLWSAWRSWRFGFAIVVCVLLGSSGYYYAFFACFFLLVAAGLLLLQQRKWHCLILPASLIALITLLIVANLWPSIRYVQQEGSTAVINRVAADADAYGLRMAQMLLPVRFHRWQPLADLKTQYNMRLLINENDDASLGFVGALGFLGLLGWFLLRRPALAQLNEPGGRGLVNHLSLLTLCGFLLATIGGFGSLIALFGLTQLRAYNRISIFLAFFCLLAAGLWLEQLENWLKAKFMNAAWLKFAFAAVLAAVVWLGLLDQISPYFLPNYETVRKEFESDFNFVKQIEAQVPHGAMIYQLPMMSFPEHPKFLRMFDYDLARPYLHSAHLRWSYGTIKGRETDFWVRQVAVLTPPELAATLAYAGFSGIFIDRYGYQDNGAKYEAELKALLDVKPLNGPNGRQLFFDLTGYAKRLRAQMSPAEWALREDAALHPVMTLWQQGFADEEGAPGDYWRWCAARGRMQFVNRSNRAQSFDLETTFYADGDGMLQMWGFLNERLAINRQGAPFTQRITIPPGLHTVRFASDARRILTPNDFRELVFRVRNFKLKPVEPSPLIAAPAPAANASAVAR